MKRASRTSWQSIFLVGALAVGTFTAGTAGAAPPTSTATPKAATPAASTPAASTPSGATPSTTAPSAADSSTTEKVIVMLANQLTATPDDRGHGSKRSAAARSDQTAVLGRLAGPAPKNVKHFTVGNAFSATVTKAQAAALAADPAVSSVTPDQLVAVAPVAATPTSSSSGPAVAAAGTPSVPATACSTNPNKPLLEPEALSTINARSDDPTAKTAAALGIDGSGVKVAYIADGINPNNAGFTRKNGTSAIVDYQDFYGDGPNAVTSGAEAFGDASSIAAQGNVTYDVAQFANPKAVSFPGGHCYIRIMGVAPGASIVALKAGAELLPNSAILQAIDYAVTVDHVDVLNESFGSNQIPDNGARNTVQQFDDQAVAAGVTVTVSTGDAGVTSTIGNPSTDPNVISAGASTDSRLYAQTGYALADLGNGKWQDNNISSLSSAGITQNGRTIDVSAPGEADWAVCDASGNFTGCTNFNGGLSNIQAFGGTSQSAPMTAGVAALVIQAYRKTHGGTSPTPAVVKQLITSTTTDLGFNGADQGSGVLNARAAVEAALTYPGATTATPGVSSNIALSTNQLTLVGAPGTTQTGQVTVQNVGTKPLAVLPATRQDAQLSRQTQTVAISAASTQTTPYPTTGLPWATKTVTFTVPGGADVLNGSIIWNSGAAIPVGTGPVVRMSLYAPDGTYAANTRPQGGASPANYGTVLVRQPAPGTWTAILYTPQTGGFTGNVSLQTTTTRSVPIGRVSPAIFTLKPGQKKTLKVSLPTPATGGDVAYTMSVASSGGHQTAVPVIMRALVPTKKGVGHFSGTITGGNARGSSPAQTFSYSCTVPKGQKDLDVSVTLRKSGADLLQSVLVDPNGETPSVNGNTEPDGVTHSKTVTNTVAAPIPGQWRYVIVVENPVSGTSFTQAFNGTVAFNTQQVTATGLPQGDTLKKGAAHQATVLVTNNSKAPIAVQTDARTTGTSSVQLAPIFAGSTFSLPLNVEELSSVPAFLVPPGTKSLSLSAATTVPAQVELSSTAGGIDVFGDLQQAQNGSTISTATVKEKAPGTVGQGIWSPYVQEIGPYGAAGAPAASTTLVATAVTAGFDNSVTSSTGDPWLNSVNATAPSGTPVVINPGQQVAIVVTIKPTAAKGTTVTGVLHLVTPPSLVANFFYTTGDVLANLPYSYKVG